MSVETNFKKLGTGMDFWGKQRLELGVLLRDKVLDQLGIPWVIDNGCLLGAYRNGKFIKHDDDFDIAIFFESNPLPSVPDILNKLRQLLPGPYEARYVSTYAKKIEIYDPSYGSFLLDRPSYNGEDFHYVTADLQFFQRFDDKYHWMYYGQKNMVAFPVDVVFPLGCIRLECEEFQAPFDVEQYLQIIYGSISPNAKYNPNTGLYEEYE